MKINPLAWLLLLGAMALPRVLHAEPSWFIAKQTEATGVDPVSQKQMFGSFESDVRYVLMESSAPSISYMSTNGQQTLSMAGEVGVIPEANQYFTTYGTLGGGLTLDRSGSNAPISVAQREVQLGIGAVHVFPLLHSKYVHSWVSAEGDASLMRDWATTSTLDTGIMRLGGTNWWLFRSEFPVVAGLTLGVAQQQSFNPWNINALATSRVGYGRLDLIAQASKGITLYGSTQAVGRAHYSTFGFNYALTQRVSLGIIHEAGYDPLFGIASLNVTSVTFGYAMPGW